jgi:hypothetical protein
LKHQFTGIWNLEEKKERLIEELRLLESSPKASEIVEEIVSKG